MVAKVNADIALKAKQCLVKLKRAGTTANKLRALIAAHQHGVKKVAEVFNVSRTSIYRWAKELDQKGLDGIINKPKLQDGTKLKKHHKAKVSCWLGEEPNITILGVKEKLENECNLKVSIATVHRAMKSVGFSYITPRKNHYKQNKDEVAKFKKKSAK